MAQSELDMDLVKTILGEYRIHNADITLRYDANAEDLIDVIEGNRVYIPCIYVLNKIDQISIEVRMPHLTDCGLVTQYGDIDLSQLWLGQWLAAWQHQAITWTNVDLSSVRSYGIHLRALSKEDLKNPISKTRLKIAFFKSLADLRTNVLRGYVHLPSFSRKEFDNASPQNNS